MKNSFRKIPISRANFKLHEIMTDYSNEFSYVFSKMSKSAHLAEGPGGFIESFVDFSSYYNIHNVDKYTITLKPTDNSSMQVPLLKFSKKYIEKYNIKIDYGIDGTGDIFKLHNINHFVNFVNHIPVILSQRMAVLILVITLILKKKNLIKCSYPKYYLY